MRLGRVYERQIKVDQNCELIQLLTKQGKNNKVYRQNFINSIENVIWLYLPMKISNLIITNSLSPYHNLNVYVNLAIGNKVERQYKNNRQAQRWNSLFKSKVEKSFPTFFLTVIWSDKLAGNTPTQSHSPESKENSTKCVFECVCVRVCMSICVYV